MGSNEILGESHHGTEVHSKTLLNRLEEHQFCWSNAEYHQNCITSSGESR